MTETTFTMHIDKELHRQLKIRVASLGITLKDYFLNFVKSDLYNEDEIHSFEDFNEETKKCIEETNNNLNNLPSYNNAKEMFDSVGITNY